MSFEIAIRPEAEADLKDIHEWYESQSAGLGEEFLLNARESLDRISLHPEMYALTHLDVRRAPIRRFRYHIFYAVREETVMVLSVHHASRDPRLWRRRWRRQ